MAHKRVFAFVLLVLTVRMLTSTWAAKSGGLSDPRNGAMLKLFNMIDIGERAGSGIPNIYRVWREQKWSEPTITRFFSRTGQRYRYL